MLNRTEHLVSGRNPLLVCERWKLVGRQNFVHISICTIASSTTNERTDSLYWLNQAGSTFRLMSINSCHTNCCVVSFNSINDVRIGTFCTLNILLFASLRFLFSCSTFCFVWRLILTITLDTIFDCWLWLPSTSPSTHHTIWKLSHWVQNHLKEHAVQCCNVREIHLLFPFSFILVP